MSGTVRDLSSVWENQRLDDVDYGKEFIGSAKESYWIIFRKGSDNIWLIVLKKSLLAAIGIMDYRGWDFEWI